MALMHNVCPLHLSNVKIRSLFTGCFFNLLPQGLLYAAGSGAKLSCVLLKEETTTDCVRVCIKGLNCFKVKSGIIGHLYRQ